MNLKVIQALKLSAFKTKTALLLAIVFTSGTIIHASDKATDLKPAFSLSSPVQTNSCCANSYSKVISFSIGKFSEDKQKVSEGSEKDKKRGKAGETKQKTDANFTLKKNWGRAAWELGSFKMISQVHYWIKYHKFIEDWQWRLTFRDQAERFFTLKAVRFDSNDFRLNWSHGLSGGIYYQFARTNHFSWLESWGVSVFASLWWEYISEWREVISINDLVFSGLGGYPIGEPFFQLSKFLANQDGIAFKGLSFINPILKFNRWRDRKKQNFSSPPSDSWHEFILSVGGKSSKSAGTSAFDIYYGIQTEIINEPGYGKPGEFDRSVRDTFSSSFGVNLAWNAGHAQETNFETRVASYGHYRQRINSLGRGYALFYGLGSAFSYFKKRPVELYDFSLVKVKIDFDKLNLEVPRNFKDKLSAVHLFGPVVDYTIFGRDLKLRLTAQAYFDFSLVNALALNEYSRDHDISGIKTTTLYYGYYYGLGGTASGAAELIWKNLRLAGLASYQRYGSVDGRDRFQNELRDDCHMDDSRRRLTALLAWRIPDSPLELFLVNENISRWGKIKTVNVRSSERRTFVGLRLIF